VGKNAPGVDLYLASSSSPITGAAGGVLACAGAQSWNPPRDPPANIIAGPWPQASPVSPRLTHIGVATEQHCSQREASRAP